MRLQNPFLVDELELCPNRIHVSSPCAGFAGKQDHAKLVIDIGQNRVATGGIDHPNMGKTSMGTPAW